MASLRTRTVLALALLAGGCTTQPTAGAPAGAPAGAMVATAARGSVIATMVLDATVVANATVQVTAPDAGRYELRGAGYDYRRDSGTSGRLTLPGGLRITRELVEPGHRVPRNYPLAQAHADGFALVALLDDAAAAKLATAPIQVKGQVTGGAGPFGCPLADPVPSLTGEPARLALTCLVPDGTTVYAGMTAVMAVTTAAANDVIVLPVEAVAGTTQHGQVWLVGADGTKTLRDVTLGITDGAQIEITSGLHEGDTVLVPGPDLARSRA